MKHAFDNDRWNDAFRSGPTRKRIDRGFTLIELMITVAIIAVLSAIAYPSYRESVAKGKRSEAQAVLVQASQWMERFYAENYAYDKNTGGKAVTDSTLFPARYSQSPTSGSASYAIKLGDLATGASGTVTNKAYVVWATRTGSMTDDKCGDFGLTHMGVKTIKSYSSQYADEATAIAACWR